MTGTAGLQDMEQDIKRAGVRIWLNADPIYAKAKTRNGKIVPPKDLSDQVSDDTVILTGSEGNDSLRGNNLDNRPEGRGRDDRPGGGGGHDTLKGGAGNDTPDGGKGRDTGVFWTGDRGDDTVASVHNEDNKKDQDTD
ncbi:MAG: hypothetical protein GDA53_02470 [Rhodobacteraceae bacterium]|nr:hypothetical protein [Paracoccaceae bacterium]